MKPPKRINMLRTFLLVSSLAAVCAMSIATPIRTAHKHKQEKPVAGGFNSWQMGVRTVSSIAENPNWEKAIQELKDNENLAEQLSSNSNRWLDWLRKHRIPTAPGVSTSLSREEGSELMANYGGIEGAKRKWTITITIVIKFGRAARPNSGLGAVNSVGVGDTEVSTRFKF